jgi:hypothetical protein
MYTSCGWFFDELSGLETVHVLHYAGRAIQLAREATGQDVEAPFCERLHNARSNIPEQGDGEKIYKKWVAPAVITPRQGCRPLRRQLALRNIRRKDAHLLLHRGAPGIRRGNGGPY